MKSVAVFSGEMPASVNDRPALSSFLGETNKAALDGPPNGYRVPVVFAGSPAYVRVMEGDQCTRQFQIRTKASPEYVMFGDFVLVNLPDDAG